MSLSNQLSPIACNNVPIDILSYNNHCEDRFVPDVQVYTAGDPSDYSPTQTYYPGIKRTREDSGIWADTEEGLLAAGSLTPPDSKRYCSPVNSVFPDSPLTLENSISSIPVTSSGGSSPISGSQVNFLPQPAAGCISQYSSSVFQSFGSTGNTSSTGGVGDIDQVIGSMQPCEAVVAGQSYSQNYQLVITEQPELYYRARYQTEGVRAPIKGRKDNYPSVQLLGPAFSYGKIVVKLVHEDGSDHTSCSLDCSEERKHALTKRIGPHNHMATEFEDLRIRREKKKEGRKIAAADKLAPKEGHNDKVACLLFEAEIRTADQKSTIKCKVKSDPISLNAAPEPAELDWIQPARGHVCGRETVVIKGSKMTSPKVTFRVYKDAQFHELHGVVDKDRSHQNVLLVTTPSLSQLQSHCGNQKIMAQVIVTTGRSQLASNALDFEYIPDHICHECMQDRRTGQLQYSTGGSCTSPLPVGLYPTNNMPQEQQPSPTHVPQSPAHEPTYKVAAPPPPASLPKDIGHPGDMIPSQATSSAELFPLDGGSGEKQEDLMQFVHNLIQGTDYSSDSTGGSGGNPHSQQQSLGGSSFMLHSAAPFVTVENQLQTSPPPYQLPETAINSPPYLTDNAVNSPTADTPLYSPVTPCQNSPVDMWIYIEQMLYTVKHLLSEPDYRFYMTHCSNRNPSLIDAYNNSHNNKEMFVQMLACIKSDPYQTTH